MKAMTVLTIAIPTYNRATFLSKNLEALSAEIQNLTPAVRSSVTVFISDNCSTDNTSDVVAYSHHIPNLHYHRNETNLGWARNFANCVVENKSQYLLMMGDDDILVPSTLRSVLDIINNYTFGALILRPFGFDLDPFHEIPDNSRFSLKQYRDPAKYLISTSRYFTLTSCIVLNTETLHSTSPFQYIHTDLATFHLFLRAVYSSSLNLYFTRFSIASKRNNSSSYSFADVFVSQFWNIITDHADHGLTPSTKRSLINQRVFRYYPYYFLDIRLNASSNELDKAISQCDATLAISPCYHIILRPIICYPIFIAVPWALFWIFLGRFEVSSVRTTLRFVLRYLSRLSTHSNPTT
jgi:glycosyltransferase involved in cell wall biosynthesis